MSMTLAVVNENQQVQYSPLAMLYHWENTRPTDTFLVQPSEGHYQPYYYAQVAGLGRRVARRLTELSLPAGSRIGIFAKNCAEWFVVDLGIMMAGHISVPIFAC